MAFRGESLIYLTCPENFGIVEPNVYRSNALQAINFPFIKRLNLKTVVYLSPESPIRSVTEFFQETITQFIHLGLASWNPNVTWKPISEELMKDALEIVLDASNHPIMIMCASGIHQTGTLVGCLRRIQKWNLNSIIEEYRRFAGSKARYFNEQFMELFDEDLINLPKNLPPWLIDQQRLMEEEEREYEQWKQKESKNEKNDSGNNLNTVVVNTNEDLADSNSNILQTYRSYFYSKSSPLTTESRSYNRRIIGKND